jgi:hypothetical protein
MLIDQKPMHLRCCADGAAHGQEGGPNEIEEQRKPIQKGQRHKRVMGLMSVMGVMLGMSLG